jgi:hypothetical protein
MKFKNYNKNKMKLKSKKKLKKKFKKKTIFWHVCSTCVYDEI